MAFFTKSKHQNTIPTSMKRQNTFLIRLLLASMVGLFVLHLFKIESMSTKLLWLSGKLTEANLALDSCRSSKKNFLQKEDAVALSNNIVFKHAMPKVKSTKTGKMFQKLVHLDLKGAPPNIDYIVKVLPVLKKFGATGVLIEYEDMFPYSGALEGIASKHAYEKEDIKLMLEKAKELSLDIIPLIQSFGHLEFALKHKKFANLREIPKYLDMLCPLKDGSKDMIFAMIDQVLELHPGINRLHVGGDEVFHLQTCDKCFQSRKSKFDLYLHHMIPVLEYVSKKSNGLVKPIIWDDMLRRFNNKQLKQMSELTEIMIWSYVSDVTKYGAFPDGMWKKYASKFNKIWIASSFKGGFLPNQNIPPLTMHVENHLSWLKVISALPDNMEVLGIAMTGWSRFDHLAAMCELFPVSIPSMAVCLEILNTRQYDKYLMSRVSDKLGLESGVQFKKTAETSYVVESGSFPGSDVYSLVLELENHFLWYDNIKTRLDSWGNKRQYQSNISSIVQIEAVKESLKQITQSIDRFSIKAKNVLKKIYFEKDVNEWMEDKVNSFVNQINGLVIRTDRILKQAKN